MTKNSTSLDYLSPQKISFKLEGGLGGEYPIDLRSTAAFMLYFQCLVDKSYCQISGKKRISQSECDMYRIAIKNLKVGSLESDLLLFITGTSLSLPLMGFCNPKTIWDYTCYAIDLVKRFFSDVEKGKHPTITVTGNNNTVIYNVDQSTHEYPKETVDIANTSIPFYQKISAELNRGHFTSFRFLL